ncbi:hypothetical protein MRB53_032367 [Persea americana]|uniref:Uncharacterized protein n=1 Tax=Persea americana TaxID=3435 RepID=A0ACC2KST1_PERAE|nr:hypothetical protein MRB53_032367 [Persea americana]
MPPWWGKSSSKEVKKKTSRENLFDALRKLKISSEEKGDAKLGGPRRRSSDVASERGIQSRAELRSPSPSKQVSHCQSFAERPHAQAQPLPLPGGHSSCIGRTASGISMSRPPLEKYLVTASVSSVSSIDSDDPIDSRLLSPPGIDYEEGGRTIANGFFSVMPKDHSPIITRKNSRETLKPANSLFNNQSLSSSPKRGLLSTYASNIQIPHQGVFGIGSAPDSSMSSPSRSPMRAVCPEQIAGTAFWAAKAYPDVALLGSGQCSSPGSGHNSGHNSMGGDMCGQLFWQHSRGSPECSPIPSPISPGPSSRIQSGAVTPLHPRAGGVTQDSPASRSDDGKQQSHRLPLPPIAICNSSPFSPSNLATATSSSVPRSPGRAENPTSPGSRWKKGKLLGRGTFGDVYVGFNSESAEMCAMKEVTLFSDDAKSRESAKQLMQEIATLSRLRHPNIVQYYGSETVDEKLYIYLEYVSGGSIHKLLQEYGQLGDPAIRTYTQQILSGLEYLHAKNTVHRDIKGANILVDPNGRVVKLADFGMAKHITNQSCPLSLKGSPYWMAPEVIKNSNGCNLAVDIWSLGCTVLEMATTKPPWSQYEGVAAMFKIGNSKELPAIPDHLSDDGKDFVRKCLQRNPLCRPTAKQLLDHPFVKNAAPLEKHMLISQSLEQPSGVANGVRSTVLGHARNLSSLDMEGLAAHQSRATKTFPASSDSHIPRNISCPVSPIGSPLLHSRSPQHRNGRMSPSPISSPRTTSGSSTPLTGGNGAIPFHHFKQSAYMHEGFGNAPRSANSLYTSGSTYNDPSLDLFQAMQPGSPHVFRELMSSENDILRKSFRRPAHGDPRELYNGQPVLADRVSQHLLMDHVNSNPPLDLGPSSPTLGRCNGYMT